MGYKTFPLLIIPVIIYNIVAWGRSIFIDETVIIDGVETTISVAEWFRSVLVTVPMPTGGAWEISPGDILLGLSLFFLFLELIKSTDTGKSTLVNHSFSMGVFVLCLVEFLLFAPFATSVFVLITIMTLLDVLAGFIVTTVTARRDFGVAPGLVD